MKTLGLDLSLTGTGAAILEDGVVCDRWLIKTNADHSDIERYDYVAKQVIGIVFAGVAAFDGPGVELVAMEGVYGSRNLEVFRRLVSLSTVVQHALWRLNVRYVVLPPATWRTAVFGKGSKVDKEKVRAYTAMRLKPHLGNMLVEMVDLNVLEAFLVALAAWKMETGAAPRPVARKPRKKEGS